MPTIPFWMSTILKTIVGAFLGTAVGLAFGVGATFLLLSNTTTRGTCSESMALGMVAMSIVVLSAGIGFSIGTGTAFASSLAERTRQFH